MKFFYLAVFGISISASAMPCSTAVNDFAHVLNISTVQAAVSALAAKGADPKVITDNDYSGTPGQEVNAYHRNCVEWQSAGGGVKNNLVVLVVFPNRHKVGLFTGQEWATAINSSVVCTQYMIPAFKDGDYTRGIVNGLTQSATMIQGFQTSVLHPGTTTVQEQATDFSGLWQFFEWLLVVGVLVAFIVIAWKLYKYYTERSAARNAAQQDAVNARDEVANYVLNNPDDTKTAERFSRFNNSETMNPDTKGLEALDYIIIRNGYRNLLQSKIETTAPIAYKPAQYNEPVSLGATETVPVTTASTHTTINNYVEPAYVPAPYIPVPIIIEPEPVEHHHTDSDSGWGGSSSSDSGSSGWSDSSSSSSYDSGSSSFSDNSSSSSFGGDSGGFSGGDSSW